MSEPKASCGNRQGCNTLTLPKPQASCGSGGCALPEQFIVIKINGVPCVIKIK